MTENKNCCRTILKSSFLTFIILCYITNAIVTPGVKKLKREQYSRLEQIPNIGPSLAKDLRLIGVSHPKDLIGRNPYAMYEELCRKTERRHDPCVIDAFISAVRFMQGEPKRPWWSYTSERKQMLAGMDAARARLKSK